jgi:phosphoglycolate phosphatase (TIGR01487 family)
MEIKAIACDVDQTLTDESALLDMRAVEVVRYLEAGGVPVILVTSREYMTAGSLSTFMGACGVVAAEDGTVIGNFWDFKGPTVLGDCARIERGLAVLHEALGDQVTVFPWPGRICSACLMRSPTYSAEEGNAILAEHEVGARLLDSGVAYLLIDADTNKGRGLREAARLLNVDPENIAAIGDNFNDLDMFAVAGYSIAVGNAPQAVKDQVDYACTARFGGGFCEGVRHALERFPVPGVYVPPGEDTGT